MFGRDTVPRLSVWGLPKRIFVRFGVVYHTIHVVSRANRVPNHSLNSQTEYTLEHLVHNCLALLIAHEAGGVAQERTNHTGSEAGEERLHTALLEQSLGTVEEALVLAVRLHDAVNLKLGLRITGILLCHLHDIDGIDTRPVGQTAHASCHELGEHSLILHVAEGLQITTTASAHLSVLQAHATIPLIDTEVEGNGDDITKESRAESLVAAENAVRLDDLLDRAAHSGELRLVLRIVLRANNLDLQLRLEEIHRRLDKRDGNTGAGASQEGVRKRQDLSMANDLLHLTVGKELDGVEDHVAYVSLGAATQYPTEAK